MQVGFPRVREEEHSLLLQLSVELWGPKATDLRIELYWGTMLASLARTAPHRGFKVLPREARPARQVPNRYMKVLPRQMLFKHWTVRAVVLA